MQDAQTTAGRPLRILHLAFEDHRRPGSGGGSLRNHRINSRLADKHHVTAIVSRYPGAKRRVEDGVEYVPLGLNIGHLGSIIAYHLAVPWYAYRHRADVIVEEFAAPHSADLVPFFTGCPTVAVVQYLFAEEKSREYHLPFWAVERVGVGVHTSFIVVSQFIADRIRAINPAADIEVVYAGVDLPVEFRPTLARSDLLFLGRFEVGMKGLDTLVKLFLEVHKVYPDLKLRIAGSGPHEHRLREMIDLRGLTGSVVWLGRLEGRKKWEALAHAEIVLMPSRYETFGLVALEAMAVGTPVVGSAIPSLVEINANSPAMILLPPENAGAMASAVISLLDDPVRRSESSAAALQRVSDFNWETAVSAHDRIYQKAAGAPSRTLSQRFYTLGKALRTAARGRTGPRFDA
jgi:glycosyltransferase involved in cell wall biosynthesis